MSEIITYDVNIPVKVCKHSVDIKGLQQLLRNHKCIKNKDLAELLHIPLTQVEHYFRTDKYFAIPDPSIWFNLKEFLHITDNSFDESIMTFIEQPGVYDMGNRIYDSNGISPTILADSGNKLYLTVDKIKR